MTNDNIAPAPDWKASLSVEITKSKLYMNY